MGEKRPSTAGGALSSQPGGFSSGSTPAEPLWEAPPAAAPAAGRRRQQASTAPASSESESSSDDGYSDANFEEAAPSPPRRPPRPRTGTVAWALPAEQEQLAPPQHPPPPAAPPPPGAVAAPLAQAASLSLSFERAGGGVADLAGADGDSSLAAERFLARASVPSFDAASPLAPRTPTSPLGGQQADPAGSDPAAAQRDVRPGILDSASVIPPAAASAPRDVGAFSTALAPAPALPHSRGAFRPLPGSFGAGLSGPLFSEPVDSAAYSAGAGFSHREEALLESEASARAAAGTRLEDTVEVESVASESTSPGQAGWGGEERVAEAASPQRGAETAAQPPAEPRPTPAAELDPRKERPPPPPWHQTPPSWHQPPPPSWHQPPVQLYQAALSPSAPVQQQPPPPVQKPQPPPPPMQQPPPPPPPVQQPPPPVQKPEPPPPPMQQPPPPPPPVQPPPPPVLVTQTPLADDTAPVSPRGGADGAAAGPSGEADAPSTPPSAHTAPPAAATPETDRKDVQAKGAEWEAAHPAAPTPPASGAEAGAAAEADHGLQPPPPLPLQGDPGDAAAGSAGSHTSRASSATAASAGGEDSGGGAPPPPLRPRGPLSWTVLSADGGEHPPVRVPDPYLDPEDPHDSALVAFARPQPVFITAVFDTETHEMPPGAFIEVFSSRGDRAQGEPGAPAVLLVLDAADPGGELTVQAWLSLPEGEAPSASSGGAADGGGAANADAEGGLAGEPTAAHAEEPRGAGPSGEEAPREAAEAAAPADSGDEPRPPAAQPGEASADPAPAEGAAPAPSGDRPGSPPGAHGAGGAGGVAAAAEPSLPGPEASHHASPSSTPRRPPPPGARASDAGSLTFPVAAEGSLASAGGFGAAAHPPAEEAPGAPAAAPGPAGSRPGSPRAASSGGTSSMPPPVKRLWGAELTVRTLPAVWLALRPVLAEFPEVGSPHSALWAPDFDPRDPAEDCAFTGAAPRQWRAVALAYRFAMHPPPRWGAEEGEFVAVIDSAHPSALARSRLTPRPAQPPNTVVRLGDGGASLEIRQLLRRGRRSGRADASVRVFVEHAATGVRLADARLGPADPGFADPSGFRSQFRVVWEPYVSAAGVFEAAAAAAGAWGPGQAAAGPWRPLRVIPPEPRKQLCSAVPLFYLDADGAGRTVKVTVRPRPWRPLAAAFARPAVLPDDRAEVVAAWDEEDEEGRRVWAVVVRLRRTLALRQRDMDVFSLHFESTLRGERLLADPSAAPSPDPVPWKLELHLCGFAQPRAPSLPTVVRVPCGSAASASPRPATAAAPLSARGAGERAERTRPRRQSTSSSMSQAMLQAAASLAAEQGQPAAASPAASGRRPSTSRPRSRAPEAAASPPREREQLGGVSLSAAAALVRPPLDPLTAHLQTVRPFGTSAGTGRLLQHRAQRPASPRKLSGEREPGPGQYRVARWPQSPRLGANREIATGGPAGAAAGDDWALRPLSPGSPPHAAVLPGFQFTARFPFNTSAPTGRQPLRARDLAGGPAENWVKRWPSRSLQHIVPVSLGRPADGGSLGGTATTTAVMSRPHTAAATARNMTA